MWLFLMNKEWQKEVSLQIESLHKIGSLQLIISSNLQDKKLVATLEAAIRIGFTNEVEVSTQNQRVQLCLRTLKNYFTDCFKVQLKLHCKRQTESSPLLVKGLTEKEVDLDEKTSSTAASKGEERQVQSMYTMIVGGELSELCQHPSLISWLPARL
ncbi:hypothetical protein V1264_005996 [Littorina saxatilis]|uniref:Uncharacterized protein n=1 Tax=Littorina saxatilis TaxID=31220 RepID=A0AAN9AXU6_9CAEN